MPSNEIEPLMTVDEVADVLRLKVGTVRNRVSKGTLPRVEGLGNVLRFRRSDIERLIGTPDDEAA